MELTPVIQAWSVSNRTVFAESVETALPVRFVVFATSCDSRRAVKDFLPVSQYWRPTSPTIRTAPARSICQTRFIAAKSLSSSLRLNASRFLGLYLESPRSSGSR